MGEQDLVIGEPVTAVTAVAAACREVVKASVAAADEAMRVQTPVRCWRSGWPRPAPARGCRLGLGGQPMAKIKLAQAAECQHRLVPEGARRA